MESHVSTKDRAAGRRRRIAENLNKLQTALGELPPERAGCLLENLNMGMIDADLRTAIIESGLTHYRIAKDAGISPDVVTRFVTGARDVTLTSAAKVAHVLGLELKRPGRSSPAKRAATGKPTKKAR